MFCPKFTYKVERIAQHFGNVEYGDWYNMYLQLMKTNLSLDLDNVQSMKVFRWYCSSEETCQFCLDISEADILVNNNQTHY